MIDSPLAAPQAPASEPPLIEVEGLRFSYPEAARPAVDGLGFRVERGSYLAIVGPNGSGKTSLLRLLNGLLSPSAGRVRVLGLDPASPAERYRARAALAMVFQSPPDQIVASVVEEDVAFGPRNLGLPREEVALRVEEALRAVGLWEERTRPSSALSAGQQQRLALAGALAMRPACVAFDEATAMLDPAARRAVLALMDRLREAGTAVLHVTHDMAEAARADRVLVLREGRLAFDGSPEALFGAPAAGAAAEPPALGLGLGLPSVGRLAVALGLPAKARESLPDLARRIAAARSRIASARPRSDAAPRPAGAAAFAPPLAAAPGAPPASAASLLPPPLDSASPAVSTEPAFVFESASHAYLRGTNREARGLEGLSLKIARGESMAFVGRTGSGKSTALQLLDALLAPHFGRVLAFGAPTTQKGRDLRALRMAAPLAVQRPESALFETYAADDVAFGPRNLGITGRALVARVGEAMEAVGLPYAEFRDRPVRALSGGEKRRLALAGVVAMESPAILLDEPAAALDPAAREAILGSIAALGAEGRTLVRATHSMEEAAACDRIAVFAGGRLVAEGSPARIFYEAYDPAWELERPAAVELCLELRALGVPVAGAPLDAAGLAEGLAAGLAEGLAAGLAEGLAAGLAEGLAAGLAEGAAEGDAR